MDQSVQSNLATSEKKIYSGVPLKIMKLLGTGLLPAEAARAVGVDESYISQLQKDPSFVEQVNGLVTKAFSDQSEIDDNYVEVEKILSKQLRQNAPMIFNQDQLLRTLKFTNEAKRKLAPVAHNGNNNTNGSEGTAIRVVSLILPVAVVKEFMYNPNNEIVAVGTEELTTLPSANINKLTEKVKETFRSLPSPKIDKNGSRQTDPYSDL